MTVSTTGITSPTPHAQQSFYPFLFPYCPSAIEDFQLGIKTSNSLAAMHFEGVVSISCKLRVTVGDLGVALIDGALETNRITNHNEADLERVPNCAFTSLPLLKAGLLEIPINDKERSLLEKKQLSPNADYPSLEQFRVW